MSNNREQDIIDSFTTLTDRVVGDIDVLDLTTQLAQDCARLLDVAAVGLLLADAGDVLHLLAATSEEARKLELFMLQRDEGPCLNCFLTGAPVSVADLSSSTARWPRFTAVAAEQGFASVHAIPMRYRGSTLGAMGLFGTTAGPLGDADIALAQGLAHVASIAIVQSASRADRDDVLPALYAAINGRAVVETAKGVLAHVDRITMEEAFTALRDTARQQNRQLADVARDVVTNNAPTTMTAADGGLPPGTPESAHFADFAPTPDAPIPNYSQEMTGWGRWFTMRDPDGGLYGILFTNDVDVLGLFPITGTSPPLLRSGLQALRAAYAKGVRPTDQFDFLFGGYSGGAMTAGRLQELLA